MKTFAITAAVLTFSLAGLAQAGDLTRAQVVEDLHQAQAKGLVTVGEQPYPNFDQSSTARRTDVLNELAVAQVTGRVTVGEAASYPAGKPGSDSNATRAQVLRELHEYLASGDHNVPA